MAAIDLYRLSLDQLRMLETDVQKAIVSFEERRRKELLEAARALAAREGYTLADLFDTSRSAQGHEVGPSPLSASRRSVADLDGARPGARLAQGGGGRRA